MDRAAGTDAKQPSLLAGLIFDESGERLTPSHAFSLMPHSIIHGDACFALANVCQTMLSFSFQAAKNSTTCLAWALTRFDKVETVGFDYGQRHRIELDCRKQILQSIRKDYPDRMQRLCVDRVVYLGLIGQLSETALTRDVAIEMQENGLPNTFGPGRNILFLTVASAIAYRRGIKHIVGGMCETDFSGYPDCRDDTIKVLQAALNFGMESRFVIHTPLMWLTKAATWKLGGSGRTLVGQA